VDVIMQRLRHDVYYRGVLQAVSRSGAHMCREAPYVVMK